MEDRLVYWSSLGFTKICVIVFFFLYLSKTSTNRKSLEYMDKYKSKDDSQRLSSTPLPHKNKEGKKEKRKENTQDVHQVCAHIDFQYVWSYQLIF